MEYGKLWLQCCQKDRAVPIADCISLTVRRRRQGSNGVVNSARGDVLACGGFEEDDIALLIAYYCQQVFCYS